MLQQFLDSRQQAAHDRDPWEKGGNWGEPYEHPGFLPGGDFRSVAQG